MLPLRRNGVIITLGPQQLMLRRGQEEMTLPCTGSPLATLEAALKQPQWSRGDATLILSNHFVRYMAIPWSEMLLRRDEQRAYLQHLFSETYGERAARYELRLSLASPGRTSVASAIDNTLLEQLRTAIEKTSLRLVSIQPWLMHQFNRQRRRLPREGGWFVTVEPGVIGVLGLAGREWRVARTLRCGPEWRHELEAALARLYLSGEADAVPERITTVD